MYGNKREAKVQSPSKSHTRFPRAESSEGSRRGLCAPLRERGQAAAAWWLFQAYSELSLPVSQGHAAAGRRAVRTRATVAIAVKLRVTCAGTADAASGRDCAVCILIPNLRGRKTGN